MASAPPRPRAGCRAVVFMPKLDPCDTDSLAEQIQRALPATKVGKSFVTQEQTTVVNPGAIGGGEHTMFVAGDHAGAKRHVTDLLTSYGWSDILDLGPLVCARGMEMYALMHSAIGFSLGHQFGGHFRHQGSALTPRSHRPVAGAPPTAAFRADPGLITGLLGQRFGLPGHLLSVARVTRFRR